MKNIKELKTLPNTDEDIITDLRQEILSLKKENDELRDRNTICLTLWLICIPR